MVPSTCRHIDADGRHSIIERLFPCWSADSAPYLRALSEGSGDNLFEDADGDIVPEHTTRWLHQWRRPSQMDVTQSPRIPAPILELEHVDVGGKPVSGGSSGRVFKGALYYGHANFEWLLGQILLVQQVQGHLPPGQYLFELIHPQKDGCPVLSPSGKYCVKLWIVDNWRIVTVDDRVPLDLFGRPLCVASRPMQLWPILLCKALLKVMSAYQILEHKNPHKAPVFTFLTSWPLEDLISSYSNIGASTGELFDRLEASTQMDASPSRRYSITSVQLRDRHKQRQPPPRVLVFTGPAGAGTRAIMAGLVDACPRLFARVVTHTSRRPKEHELDGIDYHFTDAPTLRSMQAAQELLDIQHISTVHGGTCLYGVSYAAIRSVASCGKVCLVALDVQGAETLYRDDRIDAAFIYVNAPSWRDLESRVAKRLKEDESTVQKRLLWAESQVSRALVDTELVDVLLPSMDPQSVLRSLKEVAATLSPIVRNRVHGIPQYILEYADVVVANHVQAPDLKPIVVTGPDTGERSKLLQALSDEFPDVFVFAPLVSDERVHEEVELALKRPFSAELSPSRLLSPNSSQELDKSQNQRMRVKLPPSLAVNLHTPNPVNAQLEQQDFTEANLSDMIASSTPDTLLHHTSYLGEVSTSESLLAHLPRQTPPPAQLVDAKEFTKMQQRGELVGVHSPLFCHEKVQCRVGLLSCKTPANCSS